MREWDVTETSKCRWSDAAELAFNKPKVLWEDSHVDYQGSAKFFGWNGAAVLFYEWSYGSCSGCDPWEGLYDGQDGTEKLAALMRGGAVWFDTLDPLLRFAEPIIKQGITNWSTYGKSQGDVEWEKFVKEVENLL
jgi:hypothetical protein